MGYKEKMAKKHQIPYMTAERIYLGDDRTFVESTGYGTWQIVSPKAKFKIKEDGGIYISGNVEIDSPIVAKEDFICKKKIVAEKVEDKSNPK